MVHLIVSLQQQWSPLVRDGLNFILISIEKYYTSIFNQIVIICSTNWSSIGLQTKQPSRTA